MVAKNGTKDFCFPLEALLARVVLNDRNCLFRELHDQQTSNIQGIPRVGDS